MTKNRINADVKDLRHGIPRAHTYEHNFHQLNSCISLSALTVQVEQYMHIKLKDHRLQASVAEVVERMRYRVVSGVHGRIPVPSKLKIMTILSTFKCSQAFKNIHRKNLSTQKFPKPMGLLPVHRKAFH